jgi:hypothetical protein
MSDPPAGHPTARTHLLGRDAPDVGAEALKVGRAVHLENELVGVGPSVRKALLAPGRNEDPHEVFVDDCGRR